MSYIGKNPKWNTSTHTPQSADPANPVEGTQFYSDGTSRAEGLWVYKNLAWTRVGSGSDSGINFDPLGDIEEATTADFSNSGGTLSITTTGSEVGRGTQSLKFVATAGSQSFQRDSLDIPLGYRKNQFLGLKFIASLTEEVTVTLHDVTNATDLLTQTISGNGTYKPYQFIAALPDTAEQVYYKIESSAADTILIDDIVVTPNALQLGEQTEVQTVRYGTMAGNGSTATRVPYFSNVLENSGASLVEIANDSTNGFSVTALVDCTVNMTYSVSYNTANTYGISLNASSTSTNYASLAEAERLGTDLASGASVSASHSISIELTAGDVLRPQHDGASAGVTGRNSIVLTATAQSDTVITASNASETVTKILSADVTSTGNVADFNFTDLTIGQWYMLSGSVKLRNDAAGTSHDYSATITNGANTISSLRNLNYGASNNLWGDTIGVATFFQATATSIVFNVGFTSDAVTAGDGTKGAAGSYLELTNITSQFLSAVPLPAVATIKDAKADGVTGGSLTSGSWQTRDLNTLEGETTFVSLSSNQFTLPAGKYLIQAECQGYRVDAHQCRLRNITDSTSNLGLTANSASTDSTPSTTSVSAQLTLTSTKVFELQHRGATTDTDGRGLAGSLGDGEVYASVTITKLK